MLISKRKITVREILASEDFRSAKVLAGESGLDRVVDWPHILETWNDASLWVDGGEMIFCSAIGISNEDDLIPFFKNLLEKGISAFCLQLSVYIDKVAPEMIRLANEYSCPLIVFEELVRFLDVTRNITKNILEFINKSTILEKKNLANNDWMLGWLEGEVSEERICELLEQSQTDLRKFHFFAIVVEYKKHKIDYSVSENEYLQISKTLRALFEEQQFLLYPFFANGLLTGIVLDFGKTDTWKERYGHVIANFNKGTAVYEGKPHVLIACGYRSASMRDIPRSYQTAVHTLHICQQFQTDRYIYDDLGIFFLLSLVDSAEKRNSLKDFVMDHLRPLLTFDIANNGKLVRTIKKYYEYGGNKQQTALDLGVTRQSLYYRLEQIEELMGPDIWKQEHRLKMELALCFYDYLFEEI